jgi:branched-chain amino acid transport system ATP-binding protein
VDLTVRAGEIVTLLGPNGAGKTTLLRASSGLLPWNAGSVRFGGTDLRGVGPRETAEAGLAQRRAIQGHSFKRLASPSLMFTWPSLRGHQQQGRARAARGQGSRVHPGRAEPLAILKNGATASSNF